jgi:hypothetical protein
MSPGDNPAWNPLDVCWLLVPLHSEMAKEVAAWSLRWSSFLPSSFLPSFSS